MSYRALFGRAGVRCYLAGQMVSFLGDSAMWMACGIWVKTLTGSNGAAGLTFFFYLLPTLLNAPAGLISNRVRRRPFLVRANLAGAAILLPLFLVHSARNVWLIYAVMVCYGTVNVMIGPAQSAFLAYLVPHDLLATANGTLRSGQETLRIVAPLIGAGIFTWLGGPVVALLDMATFIIAAGLTSAVKVREERPHPSGHNVRTDLAEGLRFLAANPLLRRATLACALFMLAAGLGESARWAVVSQGLHKPAAFIAIYQLALGIGAVIGGLISSGLIGRTGETLVMALGLALFAAGTALTITSTLVVVLTGAGLTGAAIPLAVVAALTLLQRTAPHRLQGRVYSSFELATTGPQIASIAVGAALISVVDYRVLLAAMTVVGLISALLALRAGRSASSKHGNNARDHLKPPPSSRLVNEGQVTSERSSHDYERTSHDYSAGAPYRKPGGGSSELAESPAASPRRYQRGEGTHERRGA